MTRKEMFDVAAPPYIEDGSRNLFNLSQAVFIQLSTIIGETLEKVRASRPLPHTRANASTTPTVFQRGLPRLPCIFRTGLQITAMASKSPPRTPVRGRPPYPYRACLVISPTLRAYDVVSSHQGKTPHSGHHQQSRPCIAIASVY